MMLRGKLALITGATAGIGQAIAEVFAREGARLILTGRREARLKNLAVGLAEQFGTDSFVLPLDISSREQVHTALSTLPLEFQDINILVNNAGLARGVEKIQDGNPTEWDEVLQTNIHGLLYVTRAILPGMIRRGGGDILNIGSIAGHEVYPGGAVYNASKFAVDALTKGMRIDTVDLPIRISSIDPGLVETEFSVVRFRGDREKAANVYKNIEPLKPADIAETALFIVSRPAHVQIAQVIIFPTCQASATLVHRNF